MISSCPHTFQMELFVTLKEIQNITARKICALKKEAGKFALCLIFKSIKPNILGSQEKIIKI